LASDRRLPGFDIDSRFEYMRHKAPIGEYDFWLRRYMCWFNRLKILEEESHGLHGNYIATLEDATQDDVREAIRLALEKRGL